MLDVYGDSDYVAALPAVRSEVAVPLRSGRLLVGLLNVESERVLPGAAADLVQPLASVLAPLAILAGSYATIAMLLGADAIAFLDAQDVRYLLVAADGAIVEG